MLTEEKLKKLYQQEFSSCTSFEDISKRLAATQSEYVDDLRSMFCDELLYAVSMGYTTYGFKDGKSNDVIKLFCHNVSLLPSTCYYWHAVSAFFQQNSQQCIKFIAQYLEAHFTDNPDDVADEFFLTDSFFEPFKEAYPGFWTSLGNLLKQYPHHESVPVLCDLIDAYYACRTDEEALEMLLDTNSRCPDSKLLKELIGYTYYSMKMWHNAVAYFEQVEDDRVFFRNEDMFFMMAWCYGKIKDYTLEENFYREVLSYNPQHVDSLNNLGYSLYLQRKYAESRETFETCMTLDPNHPCAQNNYVRVLIALGRYKDAKLFAKKGHRVSAALKRKVESLENTNFGKARSSTTNETQDDVSDSSTVLQSKIDIGVKRHQFSNEKLLEDELTARIESGMEIFGMKLKMFRRKGLYGRQFIIPVGRLDLLCEDADGNLYVIELKKDSGYDDAYQQTANYLDWFERSHFAKGKKVYGIICLNAPTAELVQKVHNDKRMRLFEYSISYTEI